MEAFNGSSHWKVLSKTGVLQILEMNIKLIKIQGKSCRKKIWRIAFTSKEIYKFLWTPSVSKFSNIELFQRYFSEICHSHFSRIFSTFHENLLLHWISKFMGENWYAGNIHDQFFVRSLILRSSDANFTWKNFILIKLHFLCYSFTTIYFIF